MMLKGLCALKLSLNALVIAIALMYLTDAEEDQVECKRQSKLRLPPLRSRDTTAGNRMTFIRRHGAELKSALPGHKSDRNSQHEGRARTYVAKAAGWETMFSSDQVRHTSGVVPSAVSASHIAVLQESSVGNPANNVSPRCAWLTGQASGSKWVYREGVDSDGPGRSATNPHRGSPRLFFPRK